VRHLPAPRSGIGTGPTEIPLRRITAGNMSEKQRRDRAAVIGLHADTNLPRILKDGYRAGFSFTPSGNRKTMVLPYGSSLFPKRAVRACERGFSGRPESLFQRLKKPLSQNNGTRDCIRERFSNIPHTANPLSVSSFGRQPMSWHHISQEYLQTSMPSLPATRRTLSLKTDCYR